jgi:sec-independent protein translocase protein TatA
MITADIFGPELLVPLILLLVLIFGVNKLPKMAKNLGEASKEFKKAQREAEEEAKAEEAAKATTTKSAPADQSITMSKSELDALIAEREAKARRESEKPSAN